jgi:hypothetical protein
MRHLGWVRQPVETSDPLRSVNNAWSYDNQ